MQPAGSTVDPDDVRRLAAQADAWWNPDGSFRALHRFNPARLGFIRSRLSAHFRRDFANLRPFAGFRLLDIGCGGGLVSEPMARLGFAVTAIDAGAEAVSVARKHADAAGLRIDYRQATAESLVGNDEQFDAVLALEIIEHVADRDAFLAALGALTAPGGAVIVATINRTARAFAQAILGAEYLLGWIPRGTHDWRKFVRPSELAIGLRRRGLHPVEIAGLGYDLGSGEWRVSRDIAVNYLVMAVRR